MEIERLQELVVLAAALSLAVLFLVVDPNYMPERLKSWALSLGKYRQLIGVGIILAVIALMFFR